MPVHKERRDPVRGIGCELCLDEFEIVADRVQVAAGLIDLTQRERAFV
jgi:hypothetical protein